MIDKIRNIDYKSLSISDYSRDYILRMLPHIAYYFDIYRHCLDKVTLMTGKPLAQVTLVDYGGGHGFLSILAKSCGVGRVIYIDFNPKAVQTVQAISECLHTGPDVVLEGGAAELGQWCRQMEVIPDILLGMDVIEHIYNLDHFFSELFQVNRNMSMVFTTGSTPYNKRVVERLHKFMIDDEFGTPQRQGFRELRRCFIARHYPNMDDDMLDYWAANTRGLVYDDVLRAVDTATPNTLADPYNTCDPDTGSWTERILPVADYQALVSPYGSDVEVENGYYNVHRTGAKKLLSQLLNCTLRNGRMRQWAPFLILKVIPKQVN